MGEHSLVLHDVDALDRRRAGERVARVGEATLEDPGVEGLGDRIGDAHTTEGHVARVDPLGEGDQVGGDTPVVDGEPLTAAAEAGHDLVADHHDAELVAQRPNASEIAVGRNQDAVGADHRLEHDGRNPVGALTEHHIAEMAEGALALLTGIGGVERRAIRIRPEEFDHPGQTRLVVEASRLTGEGDRADRAAVIAAIRRQHLEATGMRLGHTDRVLNGLGTAVGEEHPVEIAGGALGDQPGRLASHVVGETRSDGAQTRCLTLDGLHHAGVLMADVDVHQLAGEVEPHRSLVVPDARAARAGDHHRVESALSRP